MDSSAQLLIAILAGLGGCLGWGFADFFAKKTIDELGDIMTLAWAGVFGTIGFIIAAVIWTGVYAHPITLPDSMLTWFLLAFFGALQAAVYVFAYRGFRKGQVGLLSPLFASFAAIVALVSILFLGEKASIERLLALAVTFVGVLILNIDLRALGNLRVEWSRIGGFSDVAIATVLAAIWTVLWELFVSGKDPLFYALYMFAFMTISVFVFAAGRKLSFKVNQPRLWKYVVVIGLCETIAYLAITFGYGATRYVSVVSILSAAFSLPTIVLAWLFLREQFTKSQLVGALVIILGAVFLSVA